MEKPETGIEKVFLGATVVAVIGMLLPWVDMGFVTVNGLSNSGWIAFLAFLAGGGVFFYKKLPGIITGVVAAAITVIGYIRVFSNDAFSTTANFLGVKISVWDFLGAGFYLTFIGVVGILIAGGMWLANYYKKKPKKKK
jgi:hypothetical protein